MTARRRKTARLRLASVASLFFFALSIHANALTALAAGPPSSRDGVIEEPVEDTNLAPKAAPSPKAATPLPWENGGKQGVAEDQAGKKKEEERRRKAAGWIDPASKAGAAAGTKAATGMTMGTVGKWAAIGGSVILVVLLLAGGGGGSSTTPAHP